MVNIRSLTLTTVLFAALRGLSHSAHAQGVFGGFGLSQPSSFFTFGGGGGYASHAPARFDSRIDPRLIKASRLAESRAGRHTKLHCWQYVKDALLAAGAVSTRPATNYAYQAGPELLRAGFVKLSVWDPYSAPIGAVLVYSGGSAGHVEFRTPYGFASDYKSNWRCKYHLIGVYAKMTNGNQVAMR